jgi:hypothetical protein
MKRGDLPVAIVENKVCQAIDCIFPITGIGRAPVQVEGVFIFSIYRLLATGNQCIVSIPNEPPIEIDEIVIVFLFSLIHFIFDFFFSSHL